MQLTWDETDHERVAAMSRKFNKDELLDMDFNVYLASSSSEEEEEAEPEDIASVSSAPVKEEKEKDKEKRSEQQQQQQEEKKEKKNEQQISKYRELLRGLQEKEKKLQEDKDMEMEITWVPGDASTKPPPTAVLEGRTDQRLFVLFMRAGLKETTEKLVKKKLKGKETLTPWEEFLEKKREKKKQKKKNKKVASLEETGKHLAALPPACRPLTFLFLPLQTEEEVEEDLSDDELPPDVDLSDPFFAEELAGGGNDVTLKPDQSEAEVAPSFLPLVLGSFCSSSVLSRAGKKLTGLVVFTDVKKSQKGKNKGKKKETEEEPTVEEEEELQRRRVSFPAHRLFRVIVMVEPSHLFLSLSLPPSPSLSCSLSISCSLRLRWRC